MGSRVTVTDKGWAAHRRRVKAVRGKAVKWGVTGKGGGATLEFLARQWGSQVATEPTGLTVAAVATFHEYGLGVPGRPFLRRSMGGSTRQQLGDAGRDGLVGFVFGSLGVLAWLERPGAVGEAAAKASIQAGTPPPLSARTTADPGRDSRAIPLLDTEQILGNIRWAQVVG